MRKKLFLLGMALVALVSLPACSDDEEDEDNIETPPRVEQKYVDAFKQKFPDADVSKVKWEKKQNYTVAEFARISNVETEAWFNTSAMWVMTNDALGKNLFMIPTAVNEAFNQTPYATSLIDDTKHYTTTTLDYYIIEVDQDPNADMQLYFLPDGTLKKTATDTGTEIYPDTTPF
ncbi:MAG: PepSY-like domain-containing protein [Paramuribaculum sp.]|nr:PepSY-like domain-containing protein [Paramuribaculum sp.]